MDYLVDAKETQRAAKDTRDEGYSDHARNLALIAIAEQLAELTERVRRVADMLDDLKISKGKLQVAASLTERVHYD